MEIDRRVRQDISFIWEVAVSPRTSVANLWHAESSPWHAASTAVPICFIRFDQPVSLYSEETVWRLYVNYCCYKQYCQWIVFTHVQSFAKCWLVIYHWGAEQAVTGRIHGIGQNVLQFCFQTGSSSNPVNSRFSPLIAFLEEAFIWNTYNKYAVH